MSREKHIEEMAKCCPYYDNGKCHPTDNETVDCDLMCNMFGFMANLENAGYRKQSENKAKGCEYCKGRAYTKKPLTVITKYGRRIELIFEFCPNCGRKLKGGAE